MQTTEMREKQISLRFTEEEWARAEAVAATHGLNVQNVIRFLLKRESDQMSERTMLQKAMDPSGAVTEFGQQLRGLDKKAQARRDLTIKALNAPKKK